MPGAINYPPRRSLAGEVRAEHIRCHALPASPMGRGAVGNRHGDRHRPIGRRRDDTHGAVDVRHLHQRRNKRRCNRLRLTRLHAICCSVLFSEFFLVIAVGFCCVAAFVSSPFIRKELSGS